MKIAVTYDNGQIFQHFGHTQELKVYNIANKKVIDSTIVSTKENGHCAMAELLKALNIEALICGGIGGGAKNALSQAGITFYPYVQGEADTAVAAYLNGSLVFDMNKNCSHHNEDNCGHHHNHNHEGECSMRSSCAKHD